MTEANECDDDEDSEEFSMEILGLDLVPGPKGEYRILVQHTSRGDIEARYYAADSAIMGVIFVGGAGGGYDSPMSGKLYADLCQRLENSAISAIWVQFRHPDCLEESALDVLSYISFFEEQGIQAIGIVGHAFGSAAAIQAASHAQSVRTCVSLATQSFGSEPAAELGPRCSLLIAHGSKDETISPEQSKFIHRLARGPKRLLIRKAAGHQLDEWEELPHIIYDWLTEQLRRTPAETDPREI